MEKKFVNINKIYLDPINPRHNPMENELSIIHYLLANEDIRPLAKNISESGSISPLEITALVPHPSAKDRYIVVEGNRRICALKLLADPDKAQTEKDKKYFRALRQSMSVVIKEVDAIVFDERLEARRWISLRHEGEQGGIGTKRWDTRQKTRFALQEKTKDPNALALKIVDYATQKQLLPDESISALKLTTLTRFLSNPVFRHMLGLVDVNSLVLEVPTVEFDRALVRFLRDSLDPDSGVNSRTKAGERRSYAAKLQREGIAPNNYGIEIHVPGEEKVLLNSPARKHGAAGPSEDEQLSGQGKSLGKLGSQKAVNALSSGKDNQSPDKRKSVIPWDFRARISDRILKRLYDELKALDANQFPFSATYLLRAVLEKSTNLFLQSRGINPAEKLNRNFLSLVSELQKDGMSERELKFLRTIASNADHSASPDSLGHFIHGGAIPTPANAFRCWDSLEHIVKKLLNSPQ